MKTKIAFITGVSGQDGSILAELLLIKNYIVYGLMRPTSSKDNLKSIINNPNFKIIEGDLLNNDLIAFLIKTYQFDEIYNLASQSNIRLSYNDPVHTFNVTLMGVIVLLENVKKYSPQSKVFQAGSSAMFGTNKDSDGFQRETTPFKPISPYASSKLFAHNICCNYRDNEGLFISNGILYNHESTKNKTLLGVVNVIAKHASEIKKGIKNTFEIPNLNVCLDLGLAEDYVEAMWLILQLPEPSDFIISSNLGRFLDVICNDIFNLFELDYKKHIITDYNAKQLPMSVGDPSKLRRCSGWKPRYDYNGIIKKITEQYK